MDKRRKKESTSRKTTAIKCSLNDVCVRKAIKPWINSRGQEAWVLDWSWHQAKGKKGLLRLPFGSTLLIRSRAFSLSTGHNKWSIDSLSLSFPKSLCLPDFARCQKKKKQLHLRVFDSGEQSKANIHLDYRPLWAAGARSFFVYSSRRRRLAQ